MSKSNDPWTPGYAFLRKADPVMRDLIKRVGPCTARRQRDYYRLLCRAIVSQQLSVKAARTIWNRFEELVDGDVSPAAVLRVRDASLRGCGLSGMKASFIRDLATRVDGGALTLRFGKRHSDEDIIQSLVKVKGIGRWTAEMFLMFSLNRPDVFPIDDIGIRNAMLRHYGLRRDQVRKMQSLAERWRPWRTLASWYLWRSLDNEPQ